MSLHPLRFWYYTKHHLNEIGSIFQVYSFPRSIILQRFFVSAWGWFSKKHQFSSRENNFFESYFSRFFFLKFIAEVVPEAKNVVQSNSYSNWRGAECFKISTTRLMEFHRSGTWKISQNNEIPFIRYLKS